MIGNSLSQDLAAWTLGLRYEDLPERVVADVKLRVLDTLGVIVSGAGTPMGRAVHAASSGLGSGRRARLIPSGKRTSAPTAALAHGTQAHAEDFDDTHNESIMHSSAPVVATVLALGESVRASGKETIALVAAGNELNCRLGCVAPGRFHDHGFHPTSVLGAITAAMLAGRLLGLDAAGVTHAAGIAGSQASGILEAYEDGTWSKTLHPGWAAHAGVTAGMLAKAGFTGPRTVLEGRFGVYRSFLHGSDHGSDSASTSTASHRISATGGRSSTARSSPTPAPMPSIRSWTRRWRFGHRSDSTQAVSPASRQESPPTSSR